MQPTDKLTCKFHDDFHITKVNYQPMWFDDIWMHGSIGKYHLWLVEFPSHLKDILNKILNYTMYTDINNLWPSAKDDNS